MGTTKISFIGGLSIAVVAACGGSTANTTATSTPESDVATYQGLVTNVRAAAMDYRAAMSAPGVTLASCQTIHDAYDDQVRSWMSQMMQMGAMMDDLVDAHGGMNVADMRCVAGAMMNELDEHKAMACTFTDLSADVSEAVRHAGAMMVYGQHQLDRCGQLMGGLDGGRFTWGPMMGGCADWDADAGMPHHGWWDAGGMHDGMMQDGGWMWDAGMMRDGGTMGSGMGGH